MGSSRKTEKEVEIHEFYVVRSPSGSLPVLCGECSTGDAVMLAPDHAALLTHVPVRMIFRWVESGLVHFKETPNGSLIVCLKSLPTRSHVTEDKLLKDENG